MLQIAIFCLLVVSTNACCTPLLWEMNGGKISGHYGGGTVWNLALTNCNFHYDAINRKVAMTMVIDGNPNFRNKTIWDYERRFMYVIDTIRNTCDVRVLDTPFEPICSPADGREAGRFFYGGGDQMRLPAKMFEYDRPAYSGFVKVTEGTGSDDTCVPIMSVDYNRELKFLNAPCSQPTCTEVSMMTFMSFKNIANGIRDPSVFTPPGVCGQATEKEMHPRARNHPYYKVPMMFGQF